MRVERVFLSIPDFSHHLHRLWHSFSSFPMQNIFMHDFPIKIEANSSGSVTKTGKELNDSNLNTTLHSYDIASCANLVTILRLQRLQGNRFSGAFYYFFGFCTARCASPSFHFTRGRHYARI